MILAGDVGGTKVHLALYDFANGRLHPIRDYKFPAHEFAKPGRGGSQVSRWRWNQCNSRQRISLRLASDAPGRFAMGASS